MIMNKVLLITGSNRGIGFEIARQCGKAGFHVIISGRDEKRLKAALSQLQKENIDADSLLMNVNSLQSIKGAAETFAAKNLKIDVLINNAGIVAKGDSSLLKNEEHLLEQTIATNSYGPLRVTNLFLPFMQSPGRIIMVSSTGGALSKEVGGWSPAYCISKTFLNAITRQLAFELRNKNISVNAVSPGWVQTSMGGSFAPRSIEKGAETPVWLATEALQELTGNFFADKTEIPW
jgi:NAD(P)-dependent dehydrogenase (short-subunit alcohol dehydrogenase family)